MNKLQLVEQAARKCKVPRREVEKTLSALLECIMEAVANGNDVTLMDFGTFFLSHRRASKGYNPHSGQEMQVPEMRLPKFRPGKGFKTRIVKID